MNDLYKRMENAILKEMKEYDREIKNAAYEERKSRGSKITQTDLAIYTFIDKEDKKPKQDSEKSGEGDPAKPSSTPSRKNSAKKPPKQDIRFKNQSSCAIIDSSLRRLKNSLNDEYRHIKNQYEYEARVVSETQ